MREGEDVRTSRVQSSCVVGWLVARGRFDDGLIRDERADGADESDGGNELQTTPPSGQPAPLLDREESTRRTKDSALRCRGCLRGMRSEGSRLLKSGRRGDGLEPEAVGPEEEALRDDMAGR